MNFERGKTPKEAIGIGGYATGIHIETACDWSSGSLGPTKLKTTRKVLKNLMEDPKWYKGYDGHIYIQVDPRHKDKFSGSMRRQPRELAGRTLVYRGRLYPLVPLPSEE